MANHDNIREQLLYKAGLQIFLTIVAVTFTMLFTLPRLEEANIRVDAANEALEKMTKLTDSGIPYEKLSETVRRVGNNTELLEVIQRAGDSIRPIITKTGSQPYLEWLRNNSLNDEEDRIKLTDAQAKINSIIPTLSPINHNRTSDSVTLREYITFVEQELLLKYRLESLSPLGIDGVKYEEDANGTLLNPVGELNVEINFKTSNKNVIELLNFIHKSGEPSILAKTEVLQNPPKIMSNPLITIESLSLNKILDPDHPNAENTGRLVLKFYVRGSSKTDVNYLLEAFNKQKTALQTEINTKLEECKKENCVSLPSYEKVAQAFQQFDTSLSAILTKNEHPIETAYIIGQQLQSLQSLRTDFKNIK